MEFPATLERDGVELEVMVRASVQQLADAIDCPPEQRSRFAGELSVEILDVIDAATGKYVSITGSENTQLANRVAATYP